jgi:hypothetical protein
MYRGRFAASEGGFNFVVKHFVPFTVYDGFFSRDLEMVVLGVGAGGFIFPTFGVITCV